MRVTWGEEHLWRITSLTRNDGGMKPAEDLRRLLLSYRISQAIHVAAVLGLSDRLADGPQSATELARSTGSHARSLYRLLRALATVGVYEELDGERFRNTPLSEALRPDAPASIAGHAAFIGRPYHWQIWSALLHSVRTGENAFLHVHGQTAWEYRQQHPDEGAIFDHAMTTQSRLTAAAVLDAYDYGRFTTVVDVAGGRGAFLAAVLGRWPHLRGVLFDQPHVVADASDLLRGAGVLDRCQVVAGDFFESVPGGADAYVLKHIIHDWRDDEAIAILRACHACIDGTATLQLIERVMPAAGEKGSVDASFSDLNMLVGPGGQERTEAEHATLLAAGGFQLVKVVPTATDESVIEAVPV